MQVTFIHSDTALAALINGDLDHHTSRDIRTRIDKEIDASHPSSLIIDMSSVSFMDSSGIGLIMGRYKLMHELGGQVFVSGAPAYIAKVLRLSGVDRLAKLVSDHRELLPEKKDEISDNEKEVKNDETEKACAAE